MNNAFEKEKAFNLAEQIEYSEGGVVSKQVLKNQTGNVTLFSFDKGQGLSEHTAPFDALVQVLEGEVKISIDRVEHKLEIGDMIIMPAGKPHALQATERFKMLLTMIKE